MKDRLKIVLPSAEQKELQIGLEKIQNTLSKYLIALTPKEKQHLPKMSDGTLPFVEKSLAYSQSNKEYVPPYLDADELGRDVQAVEDLTVLYRSVKQLGSKLEDTILLAGSEAYVASLSYYNSVKMAAKLDVPGAKTIYADLKQRFAKSTGSSDNDETIAEV